MKIPTDQLQSIVSSLYLPTNHSVHNSERYVLHYMLSSPSLW